MENAKKIAQKIAGMAEYYYKIERSDSVQRMNFVRAVTRLLNRNGEARKRGKGKPPPGAKL